MAMTMNTCRSSLSVLAPAPQRPSALPVSSPSVCFRRFLISLEALERSKTTLQDFCTSHFMFHGLDPRNPDHIFEYLPILAFAEASVYEVDQEYEEVLTQMQPINDPVEDVDPFNGLKLELKARNLLTDRMAKELVNGCQYLKLEQSLCRSLWLKPEEQISILDVRRAMELRSADFKLLNLLLYKMTGEEVNEAHFNLLESSDLLVEFVDDLVDYEDDVQTNSFNIVRLFYKVYGPNLGSQMLAEYISEMKQRFEEQLGKLEPELRERFPLRYQEELNRSGKSISEIFEVPPFIDETPYRRKSSLAKKPNFEEIDIPDEVVRKGVREITSRMNREYQRLSVEEQESKLLDFVRKLKQMPISEYDETARTEMYELPAEFYRLCLGKRLKYGSLLFREGSESVDEAEEAILQLYVKRAQVRDGQEILDLGAGNGALALYVAEKFPNCKITAVSESRTAKEYIQEKCRELGLSNVKAVDCNVAVADFGQSCYDRVFCIELLEYLKNYRDLFKKVAAWMKPQALLFVEVISNKIMPFNLEDKNDGELSSWFCKYFFNGGTCLSDNLLLYFQEDVSILDHWRLNGLHHSRSSEAFIKRLEENRDAILPIFARTYGGEENARKWIAYWRRYFVFDAELFSSNNGQDWMTSHYLFTKNH